MSQAQIVTELGQAYAIGNLPFRNKLLNPMFEHWQRGYSSAAGGYQADRWNLQLGPGTVVSQQRVVPNLGQYTPGGRYAYMTTVSNAGDAANGVAVLTQRIEGVDTLQGTVTVSFYAAVNAGQKIAVNMTQNFGTGGSPSAGVQVLPVVVSPTGALGPRYYATFTLPSLVGKTIGSAGNDFVELEFYVSGGTNYGVAAGGIGPQTGNFYIGGVQLETGPIATPLEVRPSVLELAMCQRYYEFCQPQQMAGAVYAAGYASAGIINYKTTKRAMSTVTVTGLTATGWAGQGNTVAFAGNSYATYDQCGFVFTINTSVPVNTVGIMAFNVAFNSEL